MADVLTERARALKAAAEAAQRQYQSIKANTGTVRNALSSYSAQQQGLSSMQPQVRQTNPNGRLPGGASRDPLRSNQAAMQSRIARNQAAANFKPARQMGNNRNVGFDNNMVTLRNQGGNAHEVKLQAINSIAARQDAARATAEQMRNDVIATQQGINSLKNPTRGGGGSANYGYDSAVTINKGRRAIAPLAGRITSSYGMRTLGGKSSMHAGMDIAGRGAVKSIFGGVVVAVVSGRAKGQIGGNQLAKGRTGNGVIIRHSDGTYALYGHIAPGNVKVGQQVPQGYVLGNTDLSGRTTGYHLHFEYWNVNKGTANPRGLW